MSDPYAMAVSGEYNRTKYPKNSLLRQKEIRNRAKKSRIDGRHKIKQKVVGNSMYPEITRDDEIITDVDTDISDVKVGDVVTFIHDNGDGSESYYTHEVTATGRDAFGDPIIKTQGINNQKSDGWSSADEFIGKMQYNTGKAVASEDVP